MVAFLFYENKILAFLIPFFFFLGPIQSLDTKHYFEGRNSKTL